MIKKQDIPKPAIRKTNIGYMINGRADIDRVFATKEQAYYEIATYYIIIRYHPGFSQNKPKTGWDRTIERLAKRLQWRDQCLT